MAGYLLMKLYRGLLSALVLAMSVVPYAVNAGDVFTGYQSDHLGQYYSYLGVRTPLIRNDSSVQPFFQVLGAGLGYTFKENGMNRDADVQFASPSIGIKYRQGAWNYIAFAGPQFRWKQEDRLSGGRTSQQDVGVYAQGEAFYWHEHGTFHAIASYTNLDHFIWSRVRATRLVHRADGPCCSVYLGWDIAAMGNKDFYAAQTGPLVQVPIDRFYVTVKGGYQYTYTFQNGAYGGIELYFPF